MLQRTCQSEARCDAQFRKEKRPAGACPIRRCKSLPRAIDRFRFLHLFLYRLMGLSRRTEAWLATARSKWTRAKAGSSAVAQRTSRAEAGRFYTLHTAAPPHGASSQAIEASSTGERLARAGLAMPARTEFEHFPSSPRYGDNFGARMRDERERRNISIASIADSTKILGALLEGLERNDLSRWPSGLYRRAFMRAYASAIGLDPDAVVREFVERFPDPDEHTCAPALPRAVVGGTMLRLTLADT